MELKNEINIRLVNYTFAVFAKYVFKSTVHHNTIFFIWNSKIFFFCFFLYYHYNFQYKCFVDLLSVDYMERRNRFFSIYNLLSYCYNSRVILNALIGPTLSIETITPLYPNSMWYERESWDLYGILYINNNDLRRILNDYGFKGFPMRKDFPLTGFLEINYDYEKKSINYSPVRLIQEYRSFYTKVPWSFFH